MSVKFKELINELSIMTDNNQHTQARVKLAENIQDDNLATIYNLIRIAQERAGYMPYGLLQARDYMDAILFQEAESYFRGQPKLGLIKVAF